MLNAFTLYRSTLIVAASASLMLVACGRSEDGIATGDSFEDLLGQPEHQIDTAPSTARVTPGALIVTAPSA